MIYSAHVKPSPVLEKTGSSPDQFEPAGQLRTVIVYEGIASGKRAMQLLSDVIQKAGAGDDAFPKLWSFKLVANQTWSEAAAQEAIEAEMVVIAADGPIPEPVRAWVEAVIKQKRGMSAAIVISDDPLEDGAPPDPGRAAIEMAACRAHLAFFNGTQVNCSNRTAGALVWAVCSE